MKKYLPLLISALVGITSWLSIEIWSSKEEAWDSPLYWTIGYPIMIIAIISISYIWPEKPWRWAVTAIMAQVLVGLAQAFPHMNLWPFSLIIFFLLSLPLVLSSYAGSMIKKWVIKNKSG